MDDIETTDTRAAREWLAPTDDSAIVSGLVEARWSGQVHAAGELDKPTWHPPSTSELPGKLA